jgi:hypothetical protein
MIERLLRATVVDLNAELMSRVHVWLTVLAARNALAVQQLMQRTLRHGGERWRTAWMRLLAPTPLQLGRSPLMPLLNALCYACLCDDAPLALLLRPHANARFTPQELVSLVRNGMPWFVVALLTDAAEQALPDGVVEGVPAAVGGDGARPLAKSAKWFAQRARVALKLGGDAEALVNARSVALACDGPMAWTVGVFAWDAFFRLLFGSRDAVLPPDERRSLTATFQSLADRAAQTGDETMRRVYSNFASFSPQVIFGNAKSVLAARDGAVLRDMLARLPPVLQIGEERADADERAAAATVESDVGVRAGARAAVPVIERVDTPPLDSASSLPAVRAGRRMRARVEALLDEARAVPLDAIDIPLLSLAERFRALADRRAAVLLFLADLDDSFVQTIERMYVNVPTSRTSRWRACAARSAASRRRWSCSTTRRRTAASRAS